MKKFILRVLLGYGILALLLVVSFFIIGYQAAGMSGAWNAAGTGLLFGAMGLPIRTAPSPPSVRLARPKGS